MSVWKWAFFSNKIETVLNTTDENIFISIVKPITLINRWLGLKKSWERWKSKKVENQCISAENYCWKPKFFQVFYFGGYSKSCNENLEHKPNISTLHLYMKQVLPNNFNSLQELDNIWEWICKLQWGLIQIYSIQLNFRKLKFWSNLFFF